MPTYVITFKGGEITGRYTQSQWNKVRTMQPVCTYIYLVEAKVWGRRTASGYKKIHKEDLPSQIRTLLLLCPEEFL